MKIKNLVLIIVYLFFAYAVIESQELTAFLSNTHKKAQDSINETKENNISYDKEKTETNQKQSNIAQVQTHPKTNDEEMLNSEKLFPKDYENYNNEDNSNMDWNSYMKRIEKRIYKKWKPIKSDSPYSTVVWFKLDRNGNVVESKVLKESNYEGADEIALKTVLDCAPYEKLPDEYDEDTVEIQFQFDYKVQHLK